MLRQLFIGGRRREAGVWIERFGCRVARASERWLPPSLAMPLIAHSERRWGEPELRLLPLLTSPIRVAIDVGAADGVYTYFLCRHAQECYAFEPNPSSASRLRQYLPEVQLHACALSDHPGELELRVPSVAGLVLNGWGTVDVANTFASLPHHKIAHFRVPCAPLDSFQLLNVGFIKIDVEGHEISVLRGARETLRSCRPNLLVEAEDRHRAGAVADVCRFLAELNYRGWFLNEGLLLPIECLRASDVVTTRYINNIIFIPVEQCAPGTELYEQLLRRRPLQPRILPRQSGLRRTIDHHRYELS
jgi:FkbM family methyltransferase